MAVQTRRGYRVKGLCRNDSFVWALENHSARDGEKVVKRQWDGEKLAKRQWYEEEDARQADQVL